MPNRTAKFASAVFASVIAGVCFSGVPAHAEDSCLSAPKGAAPAGSHWFYRLDHATRRHCWYVRDEKQARTTPQNTAAVTNTAPFKDDAPSPQLNAGARKSIADAHAELQPQPPAQPLTPAVGGNLDAATGVDPAAPTDALPARTPDTTIAPSVVASRWLDPNSAAASAGSPPLADASRTDSPSDVAPATAEDPAPAAIAVSATAADASAVTPSNPLQTMLLIGVGALAFAGLAGSIIYRFGSTPMRSYAMRDGRRDIWNTAVDEMPQRPMLPAAEHRPNIGIPRELREMLKDEGHGANHPDDRIAQMLSQLARSAQS